jgi:hypothetical protein
MSRANALLALAAFAAALGVAALLVTGGIGRIAPATAHPSATPSSSLTPSPVPCVTTLAGAMNDCTVAAADPVAAAGSNGCSADASGLHEVIYLHGNFRNYLLYVNIDGYTGPGTYTLHASATSNRPFAVGIREYDSGALWESAGGTLTVASNGRSGTLNVLLNYVGGLVAPPVLGLIVSGRWTCS